MLQKPVAVSLGGVVALVCLLSKAPEKDLRHRIRLPRCCESPWGGKLGICMERNLEH